MGRPGVSPQVEMPMHIQMSRIQFGAAVVQLVVWGFGFRVYNIQGFTGLRVFQTPFMMESQMDNEMESRIVWDLGGHCLGVP